MSDEDVIRPPETMQTLSEPRKPVLYLPDGRALVRQIGFRGMSQPSTVFPQLTEGKKKGGKKGGKRGC